MNGKITIDRPFVSPTEPWRQSGVAMKELLGIPEKAKLPAEGMPMRIIQGVNVWVAPLPPMPPGRRWKRSTHRVLCHCPTCGKTLSAGRLFQHRCKETV